MTQASEERRAFEHRTHSQIMGIEKRLYAGQERMERIEAKLDANSAKTDEVHEIISVAKGFFKVLGWIGKGVKWLTVVGAFVGGVWAAWAHRG